MRPAQQRLYSDITKKIGEVMFVTEDAIELAVLYGMLRVLATSPLTASAVAAATFGYVTPVEGDARPPETSMNR